MPESRINILYLHNITQISGGERSLLNLWKNLDRQQFEPFLIIPREGQLSHAAYGLGVNVSFLDIPPMHPKNILKLLGTARQLYRFLRLNRINIIHSYSPRNNILSALVAKLSGLPVIWHERNLIYQDEPDRSRQFFFLPKRIICNSTAVAKRFEHKEKFSRKVKVVPNGVDLEKFKILKEDRSLKIRFGLDGMKVVGMVTNLNKRKRVEFLLETIPFVIKKISNVKFLIVGGEFPSEDGCRLKELQSLVEHLGIQKYVIFTDFQDDVLPFLNMLDLFVHVTLKEACSRAILEAMASSKAVVAINDGGNPELVDHLKTGILIDPENREEFSEKIIELLLDDQKRMVMGQQGRKKAEELFDVKRNTRETQQVYLECLS
ncbi:MAG: glycosyltransferase family 4 protein [Candidatus Omnitrophica bacterium]|nr:glycosyltransferase family 4 protein [Candidatus Omnitrophota bacterium]